MPGLLKMDIWLLHKGVLLGTNAVQYLRHANLCMAASSHAVQRALLLTVLEEVGNAVQAECPLGSFKRSTPYLQSPIFNMYHSEHEMLRYLKRLENRDLSLAHSMIALGTALDCLQYAGRALRILMSSFHLSDLDLKGHHLAR